MTDYSELVKALRCNGECHEGCPYRTSDGDCLAYSELLEQDAAAAIEELLPKRGEWELIDGAEPMRWGCSRCKYMSWETSNYCPRCGAKMEVQE